MYKKIKVAVSVFICFFCRGLAHYFVSVCPKKEGTGDRDVNISNRKWTTPQQSCEVSKWLFILLTPMQSIEEFFWLNLWSCTFYTFCDVWQKIKKACKLLNYLQAF